MSPERRCKRIEYRAQLRPRALRDLAASPMELKESLWHSRQTFWDQ